jgi:hypothetical protein
MTARQLEIEGLRENLRDQRWKRRKSIIRTAVGSVAAVAAPLGMLTGQLPLGDAIAAVLRTIGA